jgi:hypothetical protein
LEEFVSGEDGCGDVDLLSRRQERHPGWASRGGDDHGARGRSSDEGQVDGEATDGVRVDGGARTEKGTEQRRTKTADEKLEASLVGVTPPQGWNVYFIHA